MPWRETCGTFVLSSISKKTSMPSSTSQSVCSTICLEALWRKSRRSVQCQLKYLEQYPLASPVLMVSETASALSSFHQYHLKTLNKRRKIIITTERRQGAAGESRKCYKWLESPSQLDSRLEPNVGAPLVFPWSSRWRVFGQILAMIYICRSDTIDDMYQWHTDDDDLTSLLILKIHVSNNPSTGKTRQTGGRLLRHVSNCFI